jgi:hypothetical protein
MPIELRKDFHREMYRSYFSDLFDMTGVDWAVFAEEIRTISASLSVDRRELITRWNLLKE